MLELLKQGGVVMYPLALCSLLTVAIFVERLWQFVRAQRDPQEVISRAEQVLSLEGDVKPRWQEGMASTERIAGAALEKAGAPRQVVEEHLEAALSAESLRLSSRLGIVGTIGNISPFVGLFGTVLGIIRAFRDIGQVGAAGPAVVASGISEALIATAAGLFVAITAVVVYNLFIIWEARIVRRTRIVASEMLNLVAPEA